ncbi:MAG: hypothetical protein EOO77_44535 [Oxalobacteraceae bacterium]|nr:MAG: hypothetical protein EOO77_44535 [Oxalobacteraceae bacterium]
MIIDPKKLRRVEYLNGDGIWVPITFGQIEAGDTVRLFERGESVVDVMLGPFKVTSPPSFTFETEPAPGA